MYIRLPSSDFIPRWLWPVVALIVGVGLLLMYSARRDAGNEPLLVYCGAGIKDPIEAAAKEFEKESGQPVRLQYGPSQALLLQAEVSRQGDLYLPGDESFVELARTKGLTVRSLPLARMAPVLAVRKGNPKNIRSSDDLLRSDVMLGQVNPDAAAAGKLVRAALQKKGRWDPIAARTAVFLGTVSEVAASLQLGAIDAGFVWDILVKSLPELEVVSIPELEGIEALVTVALLKSSTQGEKAWRFSEYLGSPDKGGACFKRFAFEPVKSSAQPSDYR